MNVDRLTPNFKLLRKEYVLLQAWKKTVSYIRRRSWTVDSLALDYQSVNLPIFIRDIRRRLKNGANWQCTPLRLVPAPKSQRWNLENNRWSPEKQCDLSKRIRPLAHVDLADQVIATALMLCLADRVETRQGHTGWSLDSQKRRKKISSYGNRLFCSVKKGNLRHRWGSTKLYRDYFQDYRKFLSRPRIVAELPEYKGKKLAIVQADLKQYYDRVGPKLLMEALQDVCRHEDDDEFYLLAEMLLNWEWNHNDKAAVKNYANHSNIHDFDQVAIPQGLAAAGFFANIVLLRLDERMRVAFGQEIDAGIRLLDACRYVDDFQLLVEVEENEQEKLKSLVTKWLQNLLTKTAKGLLFSDTKTTVKFLEDENTPVFHQKSGMDRIQTAVSGGHDLFESVGILDDIQGIFHTQLTLRKPDKKGWQFSPVSDAKDETVARFSAARFLKVFRENRPRFEIDQMTTALEPEETNYTIERMRDSVPTCKELDETAKSFALVLINQWLLDPSNVRILLVGLDLWPDVKVLDDLFNKLRKYIRPSSEVPRNEYAQQVVWYCLAEILRAGATYTGFVSDPDSLPEELDLQSYRHRLCKEAKYLLMLPQSTIPWYLQQQALLVSIVFDDGNVLPTRRAFRKEIEEENELYYDVFAFLHLNGRPPSVGRHASFAVLARRSFLNRERAVKFVRRQLNRSLLKGIARRDPTFCIELLESEKVINGTEWLSPQMQRDLCMTSPQRPRYTLADIVSYNDNAKSSLRNEVSLLKFAYDFLRKWKSYESPPRIITPCQVVIDRKKICNNEIKVKELLPQQSNMAGSTKSLYGIPFWCKLDDRWRLQLGFLLRFILSGNRDFTRSVREPSWKEDENCYRTSESHWYLRIHGMFSAQPAFGSDWLPITDWFEGLLLALLQWPGCQVPSGFNWISKGISLSLKKIKKRIDVLEHLHGKACDLMMLPLNVKSIARRHESSPSLRVCVVQTAFPTTNHLCAAKDLGLNDPTIRRKHRNHLSSILSAIPRVLTLNDVNRKEKNS